MGPNIRGWVIDLNGQRLWHEDYTGSTTDNILISPVMDLSAATTVELRFDGETNYAAYLANHPQSVGDGVSTMEITTNGGLTWSVVWTDTSQNSQDTYTPHIDLSAFAGNSSVQLGIHFYGTFAQEWWVDNVVVDAELPGPDIVVSALVTGQPATIDVSNAIPNGFVTVGYSLSGNGPTATPYGLADLSQPIHQLDILTTDPSGVASGTYDVPWNWGAGTTVYIQAIDTLAANLSNSLTVIVQ